MDAKDASMGQKIRLWEVTPEKSVREIPNDGISLEKQMEDWLASDISMLDPDLLVVGRQVKTGYGGSIDLLCMDADGTLVVVELKRGKTPREVTAQTLDYASWVQDLEATDIERIADHHWGGNGKLKEAFEAKFERGLPEVLNESHRSVVVAESIDESTERVVRYLANLGVPINVATVQCFKDHDGRQLLAQVYLVEPEVVQSKSRADRRTRRQALADENGIGKLFAIMQEGVARILHTMGSQDDLVWYTQRTESGDSRRTVLKVSLESSDDGMPFIVHVNRFTKLLGMSKEQLQSALPENAKETHDVQKWRGATPEEKTDAIGIKGIFRNTDEVDTFVRALPNGG